MLNRGVEDGSFIPAFIGKNRVKLSHLQYADDRVLIYYGDLENIRSIKRILILFELTSGLKVNFDKSSLH
ncbi:hypothetical protein ACS0TY_031463 [Phlomoides rotata]